MHMPLYKGPRLFIDITFPHSIDLTPIESMGTDSSDETGLQFSLSPILYFGKIWLFLLETDGDSSQPWVSLAPVLPQMQAVSLSPQLSLFKKEPQ